MNELDSAAQSKGMLGLKRRFGLAGKPRRVSLARRLYDRARLMRRWMLRVVLPQYWKAIFGAMVLRTGGTLAEAASFVLAAQLLIHWTTVEQELPTSLDSPLLIGGAALFVLLMTGALCSYMGERISVRTAMEFETSAFAHAASFVQKQREEGLVLTSSDEQDVFFSAPRFMSRTVLQIVGVGSSIVLAVVGAAVSVATLPALTGFIGLIILLVSPAYVYHALHSTRVGHRFRDTAAAFSTAKKRLKKKWLAADEIAISEMEEEATADSDYISFLDAYGQRLTISPVSRLIVNGTLAVCVLVALLWIGANLQLSPETISTIVIYLIFMRVFFSGVKGIIGAIQITASFVPNFLLYLNLDPRMK